MSGEFVAMEMSQFPVHLSYPSNFVGNLLRHKSVKYCFVFIMCVSIIFISNLQN